MNLAPSELHAWLAFDRELTQGELPRELLAAPELERAARLRTPEHRQQFLLTRVLQRTVLSRYAPRVSPAAWRFVAAEDGKPALAPEFADLGLYFNVSHTPGLVALVVARHPLLGVDVENTTRAAPLAVASRYFTPEEARALEQLPPEAKQRRFFELWTLKESWLKAHGGGLSSGLDRISFVEDALRGVRMADDDAARWQFWRGQPSADHLLALAARPESGTLQASLFRCTGARDAAFEPMPAPRELASDQEDRTQPQ